MMTRLSIAVMLCLFATVALSSTSDLADAAEHGDLATVRILIESSEIDVDAPSKDGMTALLWAVQSNNLAMVQTLLEAGANANLGNRYYITPLWLAAINHSSVMVALLLEFDANASYAMPHGETALMAAARSGDAQSIELILAAGADANARELSQGETALMWAAAENHSEAIHSLINGGANPDAHAHALELAPMDWIQVGMVSTILPVGGWTAAMYAARQNSIDAVIALADMGANLDEQDQHGTTALVFAIINSHYDLAATLIDKGADVNVADQTGMNALYSAVDMVSYRGDIGRPSRQQFDDLKAIDLVRLTLVNGADPNARLSSAILGRHHGFGDFALGEGATALMRAAKGNDLESMRLLLETGADPDLELENGTSAWSLVRATDRTPGSEEGNALLQEFVNKGRD